MIAIARTKTISIIDSSSGYTNDNQSIVCIANATTTTNDDAVIYPNMSTNASTTKLDIITSKGQCRALISDTMNGYVYTTYEISSNTTTSSSTSSSMIKLSSSSSSSIDKYTSDSNSKKLIEIINRNDDDASSSISVTNTNPHYDTNTINKSGAFPHILTGLHDVILALLLLLLLLLLLPLLPLLLLLLLLLLLVLPLLLLLLLLLLLIILIIDDT